MALPETTVIHVWKLPTITLCNIVVADTKDLEIIDSYELRRRIHTRSRAVIEPTVCRVCYARARTDPYASKFKKPWGGGKP